MFGVKNISRWQFGLFRIALGIYLTVHFAQLIPYAAELFSAAGALADPTLSPLFKILPSPFWVSDSPAMATALLTLACVASLSFCLGYRRKLSAALLAYLWAVFFCRNPLIANPSLAYVSLMLVLSLLIPNHEAARLGKTEPRQWFFPSGAYVTAWLLLAVGYTFSGLIKLQSPSWVDGTALIHLAENPLARPGFLRDSLLSLPDGMLHLLTWASLAGELLFLPLSFCKKGRLIAWTVMLGMHLGILLVVDFFDLTAAMVLIHLFVFDPDWLPARKKVQGRTLFYDGDCGLCTNSVKFFMEEDRARIVCYAPLQGETAAQLLPEELRDAAALSTVVYLEHTESLQTIHTRSGAIYAALRDIGGMWRICAWALYCVPRPIREGGYKLIAKHRLKIFPKGACALPTQEERERLLP
jgi:predicted DCC family thiol-disulfide oxidoreductase YuxK